jgi:hypothetical protein
MAGLEAMRAGNADQAVPDQGQPRPSSTPGREPTELRSAAVQRRFGNPFFP